MLELTFAEQVKIVLSRKNMTIKQLAELIEEKTGMKMSRQNLTQRLGRDNFQEQDMKMIAEILGCPFHLSILGVESPEVESEEEKKGKEEAFEPIKETIKEPIQEPIKEPEKGPAIEIVEPEPSENQREVTIGEVEPEKKVEDHRSKKGIINPYSGYEYKSNTVRTHPSRIGYVQVYDRRDHQWTDMTEWAFLGYQERQKLILGKAYEEPTYLD